MKLIDKDTLVEKIKQRLHKYEKEYEELAHYEIWITAKEIEPKIKELKKLLSFLDTLEVIDPYEQRIQYDSIKGGIQAQAETYSFNIESELYNQQTTKEGQKLWRKEIEEAYIRGGEVGVELARDPRYKENLEAKDVDLEKHLKEDIEDVFFDLDGVAVKGATHYITVEDVKDIAKHFYELGVNKAQKGE